MSKTVEALSRIRSHLEIPSHRGRSEERRRSIKRVAIQTKSYPLRRESSVGQRTIATTESGGSERTHLLELAPREKLQVLFCRR